MSDWSENALQNQKSVWWMQMEKGERGGMILYWSAQISGSGAAVI